MRPLDPLRSIKAKLGVVIVATVAATVGILALGSELGLASSCASSSRWSSASRSSRASPAA